MEISNDIAPRGHEVLHRDETEGRRDRERQRGTEKRTEKERVRERDRDRGSEKKLRFVFVRRPLVSAEVVFARISKKSRNACARRRSSARGLGGDGPEGQREGCILSPRQEEHSKDTRLRL